MNGTTILRRRRDVYSLGPLLNDFRKAMADFQAINDVNGYDFIAGFHGYPGYWCWHSGGGIDGSEQFPGQGRYAFLPWHRAYLKWFEDHLLDHNPDISLPYWDWTSSLSHQEGIPKPYSETNVAGGGPNPLYNFNSPTLARFFLENPNFPGAEHNGVTFRDEDPPNDPKLPLPAAVTALYAISDYSVFASELQKIHNGIHLWCHGSMGRVPTAAFDPIFWAHHCNIDRIWAIWQTTHPANLPPGLADLILSPFPYRVKDVLNIYDLGYEYAAAGAEVKL
jgi:tyrosinase